MSEVGRKEMYKDGNKEWSYSKVGVGCGVFLPFLSNKNRTEKRFRNVCFCLVWRKSVCFCCCLLSAIVVVEEGESEGGDRNNDRGGRENKRE